MEYVRCGQCRALDAEIKAAMGALELERGPRRSHMRLLLLTLIAIVCGKKFNRLFYLELYEDEPADEFVETLKPNSDGTTFLDDSYFLFLNTRYEWRKGAESFNPALNDPKLSDEDYFKALALLQEHHMSLTTPLPLADVIEEEWKLWATDPDFPKPEEIKNMGIDDLLRRSENWIDGEASGFSESSFAADSAEHSDGASISIDLAEHMGDVQ